MTNNINSATKLSLPSSSMPIPPRTPSPVGARSRPPTPRPIAHPVATHLGPDSVSSPLSWRGRISRHAHDPKYTALKFGAWLVTLLIYAYRALATSVLRRCHFADQDRISAQLRRHSEQTEQRHRAYLQQPRCKQTWLPYSMYLRSHLACLERQKAYLHSYAGRLLITNAARREDLQKQLEAVLQQIARNHNETGRVYIHREPQNSDENWQCSLTAVIEKATPALSDKSFTQRFSLSYKSLLENLQIFNDEPCRRKELEKTLALMSADHEEWSAADKSDHATQIFLTRCRGHLGQLNETADEHNFISTSLLARYVRPKTPSADSGRDLLHDIGLAKATIGKRMTVAIIESGNRSFDKIAQEIDAIWAERANSHQQTTDHRIDAVASTIDSFRLLSDGSREHLLADLNQLRRALRNE